MQQIKYYCVYISYPLATRKERIAASQRFRSRFLFRRTARKRYPGLITKSVPFLTQKETRAQPTEFVVENVKFDDVIYVPEVIVDMLMTESKRIGLPCLVDANHEVNVFSLSFKHRMKAMERFWRFYVSNGKISFSEQLSKCIMEIAVNQSLRKRRRTDLRKRILRCLDELDYIRQIDWTRRNSWDQRPEFFAKVAQKFALPLHKYLGIKPVPAEDSKVLPGRVITGHADLDFLLFGGIPENYAVILTSPSCDERDCLIKSFLELGTQKGEVIYYVSSRIGNAKSFAKEIKKNSCLFICNPQADKIVKSLPNVFNLKGVENLTDIDIAFNEAFRGLDKAIKGPRRACIKIVSDVLLQHHAVKTRRWLNGLIPELRSRGFTILAIMNPQMHPSEEVQAVLDLFEGEIKIFEKETQKGLGRFLKIERMYNQKYRKDELSLSKGEL